MAPLTRQIMYTECGHSSHDRNEVVKAFNLCSSFIQVLVISHRVGFTSSNLQKACHYLVFINIPLTANTIIQAIGRLFQISQKHEAIIWILTVNHTYDQRLQYTAARKMIFELTVKNIDGSTRELKIACLHC